MHSEITCRTRLSLFVLPVIVAFSANAAESSKGMNPRFRVQKSLEIAEVPSAFPVGFCLLTHGDRQYVAYYDKDHRMTVASRMLGSDKWQYQVLPSKVGWDSHNYITMAVDADGYLHLAGNMHCVPLIYFRTTEPLDISTFERVKAMTGRDEMRCTYPKFMYDAEGGLIFHYRSGGSGNGNEIYNVYNTATGKWKRLWDEPLIGLVYAGERAQI